MDFLSNPFSQFSINAFIGLLTIVVSIIIFRKQQPQKQITYWAFKDESILNLSDKVHDEVKGRIQASFDTRPAQDIRQVVMSVWNSGNTPILENDYSEPMRFNFGGNAEILEANILTTTPSSLNNKARQCLKFDTKTVSLEPLLLNRRDAITFNVFLAQTPLTREVEVHARIAGIDQVLDYNRRNATKRSLARLFLIFSYLIFLLLSVYTILSIYESHLLVKLLLLGIIVALALSYLIVFILFASLFYSWNYGRKLTSSIKFITNRILDTIKFVMDVSKP